MRDGEWARVGRDWAADADIQEELARMIRMIEDCDIWSLAVIFIVHSECVFFVGLGLINIHHQIHSIHVAYTRLHDIHVTKVPHSSSACECVLLLDFGAQTTVRQNLGSLVFDAVMVVDRVAALDIASGHMYSVAVERDRTLAFPAVAHRTRMIHF